ncbi:cytochrome c family protein [Bradyrhizobium sp.]|uniref:c-type cytochrome n=1 Tax=Bradyrhizobium sp. TaxID=376 RepID=UPI00262FE193|nr:cytochrome c family protein [Bradyrhizobium sp.]
MKRIVLAALLVAAGLGQASAQDAAAGEKVFAVCKACHQVGDNAKNAVGPVLNGLIGRKAGSVEGYNYSDANKKSGITWTDEEFTKYIQDPKGVVPGTKMAFAGIKDPQKIKDLIAYLHTFDKAPVKLAE